MGNSLGCAGLGERLAAASRDGDEAEVRRLLSANAGLARCSTFGALNSPLHFAAAKGHNEIAALLLENGADVNSKNVYGQTLLVFGCSVSKVDNLSSQTALHFAAAGGHVKCVRLLLADGANSDNDSFVNKTASGDVTVLHLAALHGHVECVHLLLDEHASIGAQTLPNASTPMGSIGAGSTPLHYAAAGGNVKCCQILVARGANRSATNGNGWLPVDVARIWGCHWLEHVLSPKSLIPIPKFPPSGYLSLPLMSILSIARECGMKLSSHPSDDNSEADYCVICLDRPCDVAAEGCGHELCVKCAFDLCSIIKAYDVSGMAGSIPCPLCRNGIVSFRKMAASVLKEPDPNLTCSDHCKNSGGDRASDIGKSVAVSGSAHCENYNNTMDSEIILPLYCDPFPSAFLS